MINRKKLLRSFIAAGIMCSVFTMTGQAAPDMQAPKAKVPIVVDAEEVYYSDGNGNLTAKGNVSIVQNDATLYGQVIRGNTKQNEVWIDDQGIYVQAGTRLVGTGTHYNYQSRTGTIQKVNGNIDRQLVTGQQVELQPQEVIIHEGTLTTCPAQVPDYHVSASKVEIWPGDKLIAYNAKFWIKDKVIFTLPKYQKSLRKEEPSEFPRIGFTSKDGAFIAQRLEYPVWNNVAVYGDLYYYTKAHFKPQYGIIDREKNYLIDVTQGYYRDSDGNWVKKEPEFKVQLYKHRLGTLPVQYSVYGIYGKWTDDVKSSWHQDYNIYFSGDSINFSDSLSLSLGTGFRQIRESYDDSVKNVFRYDAKLNKEWSPRLTTWAAYHYTQNKNNLFDYNEDDLNRQLDLGFKYEIDKMNKIGVVQTYDLANNRIHDQDITWYRNMHCWEANITYRVKRHEWKFDLATIRF